MNRRPIKKQKKIVRKKSSVWPSIDYAVANILLGQRFSNERLHFTSRIATIVAIALLISLIGNIVMLSNPPRYRYIPISTSGLVLPQIPVSQANHDDQFVVDWTIDAVTRLYSFDFMNFREQLQDAQKNLTAMGWESFQKSMKESNNFNAILGNKFVLTAVPTGAGKITKKGMISGNFAWKVEFPMLISYRSSGQRVRGESSIGEGRIITDSLNMTITTTRVGVFLNETGLGVKSIIAER